jgi:hypothetical protein
MKFRAEIDEDVANLDRARAFANDHIFGPGFKVVKTTRDPRLNTDVVSADKKEELIMRCEFRVKHYPSSLMEPRTFNASKGDFWNVAIRESDKCLTALFVFCPDAAFGLEIVSSMADKYPFHPFGWKGEKEEARDLEKDHGEMCVFIKIGDCKQFPDSAGVIKRPKYKMKSGKLVDRDS